MWTGFHIYNHFFYIRIIIWKLRNKNRKFSEFLSFQQILKLLGTGFNTWMVKTCCPPHIFPAMRVLHCICGDMFLVVKPVRRHSQPSLECNIGNNPDPWTGTGSLVVKHHTGLLVSWVQSPASSLLSLAPRGILWKGIYIPTQLSVSGCVKKVIAYL